VDAPVQLDPAVAPEANRAGRATAMTLLTPLRPRWRWWLRTWFWLASVLPLPRWTLLRLNKIHFARFTVVRRIPPGADHPAERLHSPYLFFESNFSGDVPAYLEAFSYVFPRGVWAIWGSSYGFPRPVPLERFKAWVHDNEYVCGHYYCAYPEASTRMVLSALRCERRIEGLLARARDMKPERFESEYRSLLAHLEGDL
jgi:hypothetical protein